MKRAVSIISNRIAGRINHSIRRPRAGGTGDRRRWRATRAKERESARTQLRLRYALLVSADASGTLSESIRPILY